MIHATGKGSYKHQQGDTRVLVGIIDTGIDGSHPDIAPNFDASLSRNFTVDIPLIDGDCADGARRVLHTTRRTSTRRATGRTWRARSPPP